MERRAYVGGRCAPFPPLMLPKGPFKFRDASLRMVLDMRTRPYIDTDTPLGFRTFKPRTALRLLPQEGPAMASSPAYPDPMNDPAPWADLDDKQAYDAARRLIRKS